MVFFLNFYKETEDVVQNPRTLLDSRASFASACDEGVLRDRMQAVLKEYKLNTISLDIEQIQERVAENETLVYKAQRAAEEDAARLQEAVKDDELQSEMKRDKSATKPTPKHKRVLSRDSCYTEGAFSVRSGESGAFPGSEVSSTRARNGFEGVCGASEETAKLLQLHQDKSRLTTDLRKMKMQLTKTREENTQLKKKSSHHMFTSKQSCSSCRTLGAPPASGSACSGKGRGDAEERKSIGGGCLSAGLLSGGEA